jgi:two-component system alkaline phosphatase synthesis response regulator PhoP/two-component system response regulator VicR
VAFEAEVYKGGLRIMASKILAVDDEKHIVRLVQINLQKEGYEVATASTGKEALEVAGTFGPDLIVMDVMMPEMDGFEALKKFKENPDTREIPIIMLTAKAQDADVFRGWQSGADLYLTKPFNPAELLTFVKRLLQNTGDDEKTYSIDEVDESLILPPDASDEGKI